jgi:hypothetical protein
MAFALLAIHHFACAGDFKALFSAGFCFQLGHFALLGAWPFVLGAPARD